MAAMVLMLTERAVSKTCQQWASDTRWKLQCKRKESSSPQENHSTHSLSVPEGSWVITSLVDEAAHDKRLAQGITVNRGQSCSSCLSIILADGP